MIIAIKLGKWILSKVLHVVFWVMTVFLLVFCFKVLIPKFFEATTDLSEKQAKIAKAISDRGEITSQLKKLNQEGASKLELIKRIERDIESRIGGMGERLSDLRTGIENAEKLLSTWKWFTSWFGASEYEKAREERDNLVAQKKDTQRKITAMKGGDPVHSQSHKELNRLLQEKSSLDSHVVGLKAKDASLKQKISLCEGSISWSQDMYLSLCSCWEGFLKFAILLAAGIILTPAVFSAFMFYVIAPIATKQSPIKLLDRDTSEACWSEPRASLNVELQPSECLWVRSELLTQHDGTPKRTAIFWNWRAPAISTLAGLAFCTKVANSGERTASFALSSNDPEEEISEIVLEANSAIIFHVTNIVAISNDVTVSAKWRILNLNAWLTGQLRFLVFKGPGSIFVAAPRGVEGVKVTNKQLVEQQITIGFDAGLDYSVKRTETFISYFRGKASLFDDCFQGQGIMFRKNAASQGRRAFVERTFGAFFAALGKVLGF